jgi:hypothetical protein
VKADAGAALILCYRLPRCVWLLWKGKCFPDGETIHCVNNNCK